jgi:RNA polymerase sigma factor (sigma-70 family)
VARVVRLTAQLWAEYTRQVRSGNRLRRPAAARWQGSIDQLVEQHLWLAEKIARQVWHRFIRAGQDGYHSHIEMADMVSCAHVGLVEAARRYDPTCGAFEAYAYRRIRGSIIDAYRRSAYREMQHESIDAAQMRVDDDRAARFVAAGALRVVEQLQDTGPRPDEFTQRRELMRLATREIERLPDDERDMVRAALQGVPLAQAAAAHGRRVGWGRKKLAAGVDKVAAAVSRLQRAA